MGFWLLDEVSEEEIRISNAIFFSYFSQSLNPCESTTFFLLSFINFIFRIHMFLIFK